MLLSTAHVTCRVASARQLHAVSGLWAWAQITSCSFEMLVERYGAPALTLMLWYVAVSRLAIFFIVSRVLLSPVGLSGPLPLDCSWDRKRSAMRCASYRQLTTVVGWYEDDGDETLQERSNDMV